MGYRYYNPNPQGHQVGDCTVRAISCALEQSWEATFTALALYGFMLSDMPSANHVWGAYLRSRGYVRRAVPGECPDCYTVADFARDNPRGTYILALSGHVVCVRGGDWFDSWDSGGEPPLYYWERSDK